MRVRGFLAVAFLACSLFVAAALGSVTTIPGTHVAFEVDAKVESKGQALDDLEEASKHVLEDAQEYAFQTQSGVYGTLMAFTPKEEFKSQSGEWVGMIAQGIEDAMESPARVSKHEVGSFGARRAHFLTMTITQGEIETETEFIVIGGKGEVILFAVTADRKDAEAQKEFGKILKSVTYEGAPATGRKPASDQPTSAPTQAQK